MTLKTLKKNINEGYYTFMLSLTCVYSCRTDIQFWRSRKTLEGLSVRSVFFNVFQATVVLLYVMDNETNTVIIISCVVGLLIECWKINKVVDVQVSARDKPERSSLYIQAKIKGLER